MVRIGSHRGMKKLIIFVCNGNIHRSVIAAEIFAKILKEREIGELFSVDSYGLQGTKGTDPPKHKHLSEYTEEWKAAKPTLLKLGINIRKHTFQRISGSVMRKASLIIAMDDKAYSKAKNALLKQFPKQAYKIHRFSELTLRHKSIKDPAGSGNKKLHREIIRSINSTLNKNFDHILDWAR